MKSTKTLTACLSLLFLVVLAGCAARADRATRDDKPQEKGIPTGEQGLRISPGHCRIIGTVIFIDTALASSGPCSKAPCRTIVRVDSVLGYGSAFGNPVARGAEISVQFGFTVAPTTKELFPAMTQQYPGVEVGSTIKGDLLSKQEMEHTGSGQAYLLYDYAKIN